jgi:hypothetical protein
MKLKTSITTAALLSFATVALAQTSRNPAGSQSKPSAYGNAYQGVSQPANDPILTDEGAAAVTSATPTPPPVQPASQPATVAPPVAQPAALSTNPDAGIVEVPVPDSEMPSNNPGGPALRSHGYNPDAEIVTAVPESPNRLPEGTAFHATLVEELSAETITPGTPFTAQLTANVMHMGAVVIPVGSYVHGRVTYVSAGRRIGGQSTMRLRPEEVVLPDGTHYHFRGVVTQTAGSDTKTNSEGEVVAKGHPYRTGSEYGMTAGSGAVIGAVVAGPVGAGVGAGIGAGLMTVHWLRERNAAVLPAGSSVTFAISTPIALTASPTTSAMGSAPEGYAAQPQQPSQPVSTYVEPKFQN